MCSVAQESKVCVSIFTGRARLQFSCICSAVMSDSNGTKFTMEVPSTQGRPHSKVEENSFRDSNNQTLKKFSIFYSSSFAHLAKSL